MPSKKTFHVSLFLIAGLSLSVLAAEKDKKEAAAKEPAKPSYELPQPRHGDARLRRLRQHPH